jgi:hypothetical protein
VSQYEKPIVLRNPPETGQRVRDAQWLLAGNNRHKIKTYAGAIDGIAGPSTMAACSQMKWRLGYPTDSLLRTFGQTLYDYLRTDGNHKPLPLAYQERKLRRTVTRPPRAYPLAGTRGRVVGYPGQGTHSYTQRPHNWQSDRGYDLWTPVGTPIIAVEAGQVGPNLGPFDSSNPAMAGSRLTVAHVFNAIYYAHLRSIAVRAGQYVKVGQLLGYSGSANSVPHLHIATKNGVPSGILLGGTVVASPIRLGIALPGKDEELEPTGLPEGWTHEQINEPDGAYDDSHDWKWE